MNDSKNNQILLSIFEEMILHIYFASIMYIFQGDMDVYLFYVSIH